MGVVKATESINVYNTEDSNLVEDDVNSLSQINKLEISISWKILMVIFLNISYN